MGKPNWTPPNYKPVHIYALQALERYAKADVDLDGVTSENAPSPKDCRDALDWIINTACGTYEEPFKPGDPCTVAYMLGRRSVGLAIVKLLNLKPEILK